MHSQSPIRSLLEEARAEHVFSAYALHCEKEDRILALDGGETSYWPGKRVVGPDTLFDIGSVTKAVVTASLVARFVSRGELSLDEPIEVTMTELRPTLLAGRTWRELLNHCSGLIGWYPIHLGIGATPYVPWLVANLPKLVVNPPRVKAEYSDLGYLLLGAALERRFGDLKTIFARELEPTGLEQTFYGPVKESVTAVATEFCLWRKRLLQGEVFDENCFALGGVGGHAGLFATARGMAGWARAWMRAVRGDASWIQPEVAREMTRPAGIVAGSTWGLGWDTKSASGSSAGTKFSPRSFGHLGYPGASTWIDPERGGFAIFLSNRIHPSRADERIRKVRPKLHDLVADFWDRQ